MSHIDTEPFPKGALIAAAGVLSLALATTTAARLTHLSAPPPASAAPHAVQAVSLRFADRADGAIVVSDARSGAPVATLAPDSNGFVRGVMRGLARDRISRRIGAEPPFLLSRDAGDRMWLQDTATGRLIDLQAFGEDNRASFAAFLPRRGRPA